MSSKVQALPPTYGIQDPQVRAFCDAITNAWQLRNGNIGHNDKQRFITKEEWDTIASNPTIRALANVGQPGINGVAGADGGDGTNGANGKDALPGNTPLPPGVQQLINLINTPITLIDINRILRTNNELLGTVLAARDFALGEIDKLKNGVTDIVILDDNGNPVGTLRGVKQATSAAEAAIIEINKVDVVQWPDGSLSPSATALRALNAQVNNPTTGLAQAQASIVSLNKVGANGAGAPDGLSANATTVAGLYASVNDANAGGVLAAINEINKVDATSTSAAATKIQTLITAAGLKGRIIVYAANTTNTYPNRAAYGPPNPYPAAGTKGSAALQANDMWLDAGDAAKPYRLYRWRSSPPAWIEAASDDVAQAMAGATSEIVSRTQKDLALAQTVNHIWSKIGDNTSIIEDGELVVTTPLAATATKWEQVQSALKDANGNVVAAAIRSDYYTYTNAVDDKASAAWTLRANTRANGDVTCAGLGLLLDGTTKRSAFVVEADAFSVVGPAKPSFAVEGVIGSESPDATTKRYTSGNILTAIEFVYGSTNTIGTNPSIVGPGVPNGTYITAYKGLQPNTGKPQYYVNQTCSVLNTVQLNGYTSTQETADNNSRLLNDSPFTVLTTTDDYGNPAGVYMKQAFIKKADITTAYIRDANITTLKVAEGNVTAMNYDIGTDGTAPFTTNPSTETQVANLACAITMPALSSGVAVQIGMLMGGATNDVSATVTLYRNGTVINGWGVSVVGGYVNSYSFSSFDSTPAVGTNTYGVSITPNEPGSGDIDYYDVTITAIGGKR